MPVMVLFVGDLLKLLDVSSEESVLLTTYGKLQPPLGKQRLKVFLCICNCSGALSCTIWDECKCLFFNSFLFFNYRILLMTT